MVIVILFQCFDLYAPQKQYLDSRRMNPLINAKFDILNKPQEEISELYDSVR